MTVMTQSATAHTLTGSQEGTVDVHSIHPSLRFHTAKSVNLGAMST